MSTPFPVAVAPRNASTGGSPVHSMWHATKLMVLLALATTLCPDARGQTPVPYRFEAANYWGNHYQTSANATDPQARAAL